MITMERARYFVTSRWAEHLLSQWIMSIMIGAHIGLGVAIVVGGPTRFIKPTYQPLIDIVHGETWIWGVATLIAACFMMAPFKWPNIVGLWLGMSWMVMWMSLFAISAVNYDNAAATPVVAYGAFALIDAALLTARVLDKSPG